ncbi:hypothetical protein ACFX15_001142 [Malus domestica]
MMSMVLTLQWILSLSRKLGLVMEKGKEFLSHFVLFLVFYVAPLLKNLVTWPKKLENMMVDWLDVL